ncbi:MAG: FAD-dependent oxidoreductase [Bacteroides stercoris]
MVERDDDELRTAARRENHDKLAHRGERLLYQHDRPEPRGTRSGNRQGEDRTLCYLYFLQNELGLTTLGLDDETFPTEDRLPLIPYHRESRRIHGKVRFNLNHAMHPYEQPEPLYRTCIAVGDYPVDHHHTRYTGADSLPDLHFHPVPSYGVPLGALIPADRQGLIVAEKSISVSNIMNGSTRLQPVVLQIGQAAGALAALAVKQGCTVDEVQVREVQRAVLDAGGYLLPYLDVPKDSPYFKPLAHRLDRHPEREGRNVDWSNETWIHADFLLRARPALPGGIRNECS